MRLYLVQHGDAVPEQLDLERTLSAAGQREVGAVARLLASTGARAVRVAHSGKLRAQQTAELLATALAPGTVPEIMTGLNPNDPVEPMARGIADWTFRRDAGRSSAVHGKARGPSCGRRRTQAGRRLRPGDDSVSRTGRGARLGHRMDAAPRARAAPCLSWTRYCACVDGLPDDGGRGPGMRAVPRGVAASARGRSPRRSGSHPSASTSP